MIQYDEIRNRLNNMRPQLSDLRAALDLDRGLQEAAELEKKTAAPDFWDDPETSQRVLQRIKQLQGKAQRYDKLASLFEDTLTLIEMAEEMGDETQLPEIERDFKAFCQELEDQTLSTLLTGEYDKNNAIMSFHAGAGGTEAQDWAQMLLRMYTHWADRRGFKYKILDIIDGEEAGIKSADLLIEGENAFGYLKSEAGVHRLVRVSPFDASGRRHTSFSAIEVVPEINNDFDVEINPDDRHLPIGRRRRSACQQNRIGHSYHPYPDRHYRRLPERALAAPEPRSRHAYAQEQAGRNQRARASGQNFGHQGRAEVHRMGQPDPLLCLYALHAGQRSPHGL